MLWSPRDSIAPKRHSFEVTRSPSGLRASALWSSMGSARRRFLSLKYLCCVMISVGLLFFPKLIAPPTNGSRSQSFSHHLALCRWHDWWDCPQKLPQDQRVFNKSILYLKPHKTGSETFRQILLRIADFYNLTTDKEIDWKLQQVNSKRERRALLSNQYDILLRHSRYRKNYTEQRILGWDEGGSVSHEKNPTAQRALLKIVTIRNPIDRLFSHYFSQRRFRSFLPKRGFVPPQRLSEEQEIHDFEEWLQQYEPSQQVFYNRDVAAWSRDNEEGRDFLDGIQEVVDFYDHVIVADQWRQSLCLFGFIERIDPTLLVLQKRNSNGIRARRFRVDAVLANRTIYAKVIAKIEYDFVLYHALLRKYNDSLSTVGGAELGRYCDRVSAAAKAEAEKSNE